jgi:hypothetical protein
MEKRAAHQQDESPPSLTTEITTGLVGDSATGLECSGLTGQRRMGSRVVVLEVGVLTGDSDCNNR